MSGANNNAGSTFASTLGSDANNVGQGLLNSGNGLLNNLGNGLTTGQSATGGPQIGNPAFLSGTIFGIPTWLVLVGALAFYMMERKK